MIRKELLYEGKAKIIYATEDPNLVIQWFKDDATAFNAEKKGTINNKGILNNAISTEAFKYLENYFIATHFVKKLSDREMLVKKVDIVPIEVVMRNIVAGSLSKRLGLSEGTPLKKPLIEFYYKRDDLGDPMLNEHHIAILDLAREEDLQKIKGFSFYINEVLWKWFYSMNILLVDFKLEFGFYQNALLLADEISPDGCRLWDVPTKEKLDKDRFRQDLGKIEEAYKEVYDRVFSNL